MGAHLSTPNVLQGVAMTLVCMAGRNYSGGIRVEGYHPGVGNEILHKQEQVVCNVPLSIMHMDLTRHLKTYYLVMHWGCLMGHRTEGGLSCLEDRPTRHLVMHGGCLLRHRTEGSLACLEGNGVPFGDGALQVQQQALLNASQLASPELHPVNLLLHGSHHITPHAGVQHIIHLPLQLNLALPQHHLGSSHMRIVNATAGCE